MLAVGSDSDPARPDSPVGSPRRSVGLAPQPGRLLLWCLSFLLRTRPHHRAAGFRSVYMNACQRL